MNWNECKKKGFVKETSLDEGLIISLIESSKDKFASAERLGLDKVTSSSKIILSYDSLREILEALALKKGFKVYNHECFCDFLKDVCLEEDASFSFDRFRRIRNKVNYYGKKIPISESRLLIKEINDLRNKLLKEYFQNIK